MKFKSVSSFSDFIEKTKDKRIVQFGLSTGWDYYEKAFEDVRHNIIDRTDFIVDNDKSKHNKTYNILGKRIHVYDTDVLCSLKNEIILIVVSLAYQKQICEQIKAMNIPDTVDCYSLPLMSYGMGTVDNSAVDEYFKSHLKRIIPKIIHCFWFSGEEKTELYKKCINSWKKYCPDYEIIEWNSQNYDVMKNEYMYEAYQNRKWAFVSDYARLDVLYEYGGIYMDMDVELISSLTPYLSAEGFFCRQADGFLDLGSGFGVEKNDELIGKMLATYDGRKFVGSDGELDKTAQPQWLDSILNDNGIRKNHNSEIIGKYIVLSNDYIMCDKGNDLYDSAIIGIHWHNGGWLDEEERYKIHEANNVKDYLKKEIFIN